ncbi:hypothetical protein BDP27DRAFT_1368403 [Rhodocollybia butyracea]|uniref:Uncharacterized protein n=1 Tax=Rhodocollybia butyracea TaxID=206335 RepID=A0A9P5PGN8_9AGAR|nr:hypothetical protein BDP27DRAFT_1368403 [Rhodocollybia butyracea]
MAGNTLICGIINYFFLTIGNITGYWDLMRSSGDAGSPGSSQGDSYLVIKRYVQFKKDVNLRDSLLDQMKYIGSQAIYSVYLVDRIYGCNGRQNTLYTAIYRTVGCTVSRSLRGLYGTVPVESPKSMVRQVEHLLQESKTSQRNEVSIALARVGISGSLPTKRDLGHHEGILGRVEILGRGSSGIPGFFKEGANQIPMNLPATKLKSGIDRGRAEGPAEILLKELCLRASPGKKGKIFRGYMVEVKRKEEDIIVRQERKIYAIWEGLATGKGGSTSTPSAGAGNPKKRPKKLVEVEKMPADVELVEEPVFTYTGDFDDSCDVPISVMVKHVISEGKKDINGLVENNDGALECTADAEDPNIEVPGVAEESETVQGRSNLDEMEVLGRGKRKRHVPAWHGKDWIFTRDSDVEEGRTKKQR